MAVDCHPIRRITLLHAIKLMAVAMLLLGGMQSEVSAQRGGGSGGFGGGGGRGNRAAAAAPADFQAVGDQALVTYMPHFSSLFSSLQELGPLIATDQDGATAEGPNLKKESELAFRAGDQSLGMELLYGHMVTAYDEAQSDFDNVRYSKLLRRPVWGIRFGISMSLRGNDGVDDPQPIREGSSGAGRGGSPPGLAGMGGGNRARGGGRAPRGAAPAIGMGGGAGFGARSAGGPPGGPPGGLGGIGGGTGFGGAGGAAASSVTATAAPSETFEREMLNAEADTELDAALGLVAEVFAEEFGERFSRGDFGEAFSEVEAPGAENESLGEEGDSAQILADSELGKALSELSPIPMWRPGLAYIGEGKLEEMIPKAKTAKLDIIFHFDVMVKTARDNSVQNISRCRIIQVSNGESVGVSKSLNSTEAANLASRGTDEREYVEDQFELLFSVLDREVKVSPMPGLKPEIAGNRLGSLLSMATDHSLRTLAEIRLYQSLNLIPQAAVEKAFDIIGGTDGLTMIYGTDGDRANVARSWAIKAHAPGDQL